MNEAKLKKRQQIEDEIRSIVIKDIRAVLIDNLRRRNRKLGNISCGDVILLVEPIGKRIKSEEFDDDFLYRVAKGRVIQVTRYGFFIEGKSHTGRSTKEFVNKAHIINGTVKIVHE